MREIRANQPGSSPWEIPERRQNPVRAPQEPVKPEPKPADHPQRLPVEPAKVPERV